LLFLLLLLSNVLQTSDLFARSSAIKALQGVQCLLL
jgi:hypothetical protein